MRVTKNVTEKITVKTDFEKAIGIVLHMIPKWYGPNVHPAVEDCTSGRNNNSHLWITSYAQTIIIPVQIALGFLTETTLKICVVIATQILRMIASKIVQENGAGTLWKISVVLATKILRTIVWKTVWVDMVVVQE